MLNFTTLPMHDEAGLVTLRQVLGQLPSNDLRWRILQFEGVGKAPAGMTQDEFTAFVDTSPNGYGMTWGDLVDFASGTEQTWNCLIVGLRPDSSTTPDKTRRDDFDDCNYVIRAFDSSEWIVGMPEQERAANQGLLLQPPAVHH